VFTKRLHLFTLLGFKVGLDLSWFLIAILVVWSLATGYFPGAVEGLDAASYWMLGIAGALGLFASIVFHEFAHAMVARRFDMPIVGITLFIFGGVAELEDEPPSPKADFLAGR
jgi:Zn-dependent protease